MTYPICPRCLGPIPSWERPGEYGGALSYAAEVEVCSLCGSEESMEWREGKLASVEDWPLLDAHSRAETQFEWARDRKREQAEDARFQAVLDFRRERSLNSEEKV